MAYTDAQKVAIRRYAGYPMFGREPELNAGMRYLQWYGTLEYRMNHGSPEEEAAVVSMLADLDSLRAALMSTSQNLDTDSAGPWKHNSKELRDRQALYQLHREELANFFGVPPGPMMPASGLSWSV